MTDNSRSLASHYRAVTEEILERAGRVHDADIGHKIRGIAAGYERLAQRVEDQSVSTMPHPHARDSMATVLRPQKASRWGTGLRLSRQGKHCSIVVDRHGSAFSRIGSPGLSYAFTTVPDTGAAAESVCSFLP